jgi:hypothetical protein
MRESFLFGCAASDAAREIEVCRALAGRCAFVLGHGRSGTTLLEQLVNAHPRTLVTAEANFHLRRPRDGFREIFNSQHRSWNNQISKLSYVPNLDGRAGGEWWQWLEKAALHYDRLGDKMAFGPAHFVVISPEQWMAFYEQRFLCSKYFICLPRAEADNSVLSPHIFLFSICNLVFTELGLLCGIKGGRDQDLPQRHRTVPRPAR